MSRWLHQVNNLLETLDVQAESVAEDVVPGVVQSVSSRAKQLLVRNQQEQDDEDSSYYSEDDGDDEEASQEDEIQEEENDGETSSFFQVSGSEHVITSEEDDDGMAGGKMTSSSEEDSHNDSANQGEITSVESSNEVLVSPSNEATIPVQEKPKAPVATGTGTATTSTISANLKAPTSSNQNNTNKKYIQMIDSLKLEHSKEKVALQRAQRKMEMELDRLHKELQATNAELQQAAITVESERKAAKLERDDLLEEQEEDLQQLKEDYEDKLQDLRGQLKEQRELYEQKLSSQEQDYQQEGGHLSADLAKLREREKTGRNQIRQLEETIKTSEANMESLEQSLTEARNNAHAANERASTAERASAVLEQRLDELQAFHSKQLQQRLARESELESTVAELSQQVANSQRAQMMDQRPATDQHNYQPMYERTLHELEEAKSELQSAQQRCDILQHELDEISRERSTEAQGLQPHIHDLEAQLQTVQSESTTSTVPSQQQHLVTSDEVLQDELERAKDKLSSVTDELMRQQGLAESAKSEVLALKGRLQVALARADAAERQQVDVEAGDGHLRRRRVKGGSRNHRFGQLSTRNMRSSIGLRSASSPLQRQVGDSLDALDGWLMETGNILRHEPLARLGFVLYLCMLHLWCFGLIVYHTIQSERTGFSELADRSRIPHIHRH